VPGSIAQRESFLRDAVILFLVLSTTPVSAASPDGRWYLEKDGVEVCPRTHWSDDAGLTIRGTVWRFSESQCTATAQTGSVSLACATEGVEWQTSARVAVTGDTLTVIEDGTTTTYKRCPEK
jgi:hypothetical protein